MGIQPAPSRVEITEALAIQARELETMYTEMGETAKADKARVAAEIAEAMLIDYMERGW